jgi:malate synthase
MFGAEPMRNEINLTDAPSGLQVLNPVSPRFSDLLTPEALQFLVKLETQFGKRRLELLERRKKIQADLDAGWKPDFLNESREIRSSDWTVASVPSDLQDRRVEITGPVNRKMVINALNSGAKIYMADFEDSHSPTWEGTLEGQLNLRDAVRRSIVFDSPEGKRYELQQTIATLLVRPRGWHLDEKNVRLAGKPMSGSLFDFGLFFFHNAKEQLKRGSGPYFYLPKLENHLEARLWNDVFVFAQREMGIPTGTIKATVLIETILASFETHEILYELRDHSAGLNCGRWDYIFSFIKAFRKHPECVLPDRAQITMDVHFLNSYAQWVIQTCHRRGIHAMGGMSAFIPIRADEAANQKALEKVREDKLREVKLGHDGTWVAHPGLVPVAREVFDAYMPTPHQIFKKLNVHITAKDLLTVPKGTITEQGLRMNVDVGVQYMAAWLGGSGCVPLYNLMEDAATAEISRTQVWQWIHHPNVKLSDGRAVDAKLFKTILQDELSKIQRTVGQDGYRRGHFELASHLYEEIILNPELEPFLTLKAYQHIS